MHVQKRQQSLAWKKEDNTQTKGYVLHPADYANEWYAFKSKFKIYRIYFLTAERQSV